ncbi:MAG: hypothetical protein ACK4ST_02560 [Elioraea tepidiphila]
MSSEHTLMRVPVALVDTVRGIVSGALVAVPREPTEVWWNSVAVRLDAHTSSLFMERLRDAHAHLIRAALAAEGREDGT